MGSKAILALVFILYISFMDKNKQNNHHWNSVNYRADELYHKYNQIVTFDY